MSSEKDKEAPPIIIKKVVAHGGHHGGAWKVAYADFVTAMMALFIVLWLLSSTEKVKKAVEGYFQDPLGLKKDTGTGKDPGSGKIGAGETMDDKKKQLEKLKEKIEEALKKIPELNKIKNQVVMTITPEGLRIELLENDKGVFFESGSPKPTHVAVQIMTVIATEIGKLKNNILVEGHTDSQPFSSNDGYTNWELSADRANRARQIMQEHGIRADQVKQVRGYADQDLRKKDKPFDSSNRRISFIVQFLTPGDSNSIDLSNESLKRVISAGSQSEAGKSGTGKAAPGKTEPGKAEPGKSAKPAPGKIEPAKAEAGKPGPAPQQLAHASGK